MSEAERIEILSQFTDDELFEEWNRRQLIQFNAMLATIELDIEPFVWPEDDDS